MLYAILGDIHANLEALEAVLAAIAGAGPVRYVCCGDIVGYGADPGACLERVRGLGALAVAGNHDWVAGCRKSAEAFNPLARVAIEWTKTQLNESQQTFLHDLPLVLDHEGVTVVHGTLNEPEKFYYMNTAAAAVPTFQRMKGQVCFVAHNHIPAVIVMRGEQDVSYAVGYSAQFREGCRYIINVGSVGQPRDGRPEAGYCLYDPDNGRIEVRRVLYDVKAAQEKILKAGLPSQLAARLSLGF